MAVLGLKLDNILSFEDFSIDFTYKSKLKTNIIKNEYLEDIPSFKYKKLNVFIGSNASGKTSLITTLWRTLLFIRKKEKNPILELVNDTNKDAFIQIDMVLKNDDINELHRFKILVSSKAEDIKISHFMEKISRSSSSKETYANKLKKLNEKEDNYENYLECLNRININYGWNLILPATEKDFDVIRFLDLDKDEEKEYLKIMKTIFTTLDPSIKDVYKSKDSKDAYVLVHENGRKIIIQEGMPISSILYLSSGTKYGVNITNMMFSIKHHKNGIYLIDEQFSYLNSDLEVALISTAVSMLKNDEQLFITTHNYNVLTTKYPFHSFYFMKKELIEDKHKISVSCASEVENRNNVIPKTIIDNDIFSVLPNVEKIYELGE